MQRLQFDSGEEISRKEYLKRKRRTSRLLRKRSKITYCLMVIFMAMAVYILVQVNIYSKYNNFKYTAGDGINSQAVYNIYFVTEGYTYNPIYSISSITSLGQDEKSLLPSSNIDDITVEEDYIYGVRDGVLCQISKEYLGVEEVVSDKVKKYMKKGDTIFYTSASKRKLKAYDLQKRKTTEFDLQNVEQILVNDNYIFAVTHSTDEKAIYRFDFDGSNKKKISGDYKVAYAIENDGMIYFVNKSDYNIIYRIDESGANETKIGEVKGVSDNGAENHVNGSKYMFVKENKLYYVNSDDSNSLWCYDLSTNSNEKIISASIEILQNVDNTVFYKIDKEMGVYLYNYDTKFMSLVTKRRVKEFVIDRYTDMANNIK